MNNALFVQDLLTKQSKKQFKGNLYGTRHASAFSSSPIGSIINGLAKYADDYSKRYPDSILAETYVLGDYWITALKAVRGLLNGELGQLDGGFCDEIILQLAFKNGFKEEQF